MSTSNAPAPAAPSAPDQATLPPDEATLRAFPKISLHDHLDGGLRPQTIVELAAEIGHEVPAGDADALRRWFADSADSGSLVRYLETFDQTIAVMQTPDQLRRVAREFVADLAADGVVYGEARWAPEQHLRSGLSPAQAVAAVGDGLAEGIAECRRQGRVIDVRQLVTAMRHVEPTTEIAELAAATGEHGVVGFDIAGAEKGFPPERFLPSFQLLRDHDLLYTIHAGEADGIDSVKAAVRVCGAHRIGHGVAVAEDLVDGPDGTPQPGRFAGYVRHRRIPLEMCPSSNLQTGAVARLAAHPIAVLDRLGFAVTVNTDNRLMSATTLTREFGLLVAEFGWGIEDVRRLTLNAAEAVFAPYEVREQLLAQVRTVAAGR